MPSDDKEANTKFASTLLRQLRGCPLSNYYVSETPFGMIILDDFWGFTGEWKLDANRTVACQTSEKAILLCKAAAMGDAMIYDIVKSTTAPQDARRLNHCFTNFLPDRWNDIVCSVAYQALL